MVNFYIKIDASKDISAIPQLDTLTPGGIFDASAANVLLEINLTESQARIFQFKLKNTGGVDDIANKSDMVFRYKHEDGGANTFQNWPIFLNHWHNWYDQKDINGVRRTDQSLADNLINKLLDFTEQDTQILYNNDMFDNTTEILAQCGRALNDGTRNIREKLAIGAHTLGVNGKDSGTSDGIAMDTANYSVPEYLFSRLMDMSGVDPDNGAHRRFEYEHLKNPYVWDNTAGDSDADSTLNCFTTDGAYNDWVDIPILAGDNFFIDFTASVTSTLPFLTENKTVNTNLNNVSRVVKICVVNKSNVTIKNISDYGNGDIHNLANYNSIVDGGYYYDETVAESYVGPHKGYTGVYPIFFNKYAAEQYTDGANNSTSASPVGDSTWKNDQTYSESLPPGSTILSESQEAIIVMDTIQSA